MIPFISLLYIIFTKKGTKNFACKTLARPRYCAAINSISAVCASSRSVFYVIKIRIYFHLYLLPRLLIFLYSYILIFLYSYSCPAYVYPFQSSLYSSNCLIAYNESFTIQTLTKRSLLLFFICLKNHFILVNQSKFLSSLLFYISIRICIFLHIFNFLLLFF